MFKKATKIPDILLEKPEKLKKPWLHRLNYHWKVETMTRWPSLSLLLTVWGRIMTTIIPSIGFT